MSSLLITNAEFFLGKANLNQFLLLPNVIKKIPNLSVIYNEIKQHSPVTYFNCIFDEIMFPESVNAELTFCIKKHCQVTCALVVWKCINLSTF